MPRIHKIFGLLAFIAALLVQSPAESAQVSVVGVASLRSDLTGSAVLAATDFLPLSASYRGMPRTVFIEKFVAREYPCDDMLRVDRNMRGPFAGTLRRVSRQFWEQSDDFSEFMLEPTDVFSATAVWLREQSRASLFKTPAYSPSCEKKRREALSSSIMEIPRKEQASTLAQTFFSHDSTLCLQPAHGRRVFRPPA